MSSVTKRISEIKQPRDGYVKPSLFNVYSFDDGYTLCEDENVHATVVGMAVDYLTRFAMGAKVTDAFKISCEGAFIAESLFQKEGTLEKVEKLLSGVKKIDDEAIINACKLVTKTSHTEKVC